MHYAIDDAMYFNFNWLGSDPSAQRITDPERVCDIWRAAFRQNTTSLDLAADSLLGPLRDCCAALCVKRFSPKN
jgi:hypothetical protein